LIRWLMAIVTVLWFCCEAAGQTTQPAPAVPEAWQQAVQHVADAAGDDSGLRSLLSDNCTVRKFGTETDGDVQSLIDFLAGESALGVHAYFYPAQTIARDVAADVTASAQAGPRLKHDIAIDDPAVGNAASAVATQWVQLTLHASADTPIGVIVLWDARADLDNDRRLNFVLVRGERQGDGSFHISAIYFGDPLS
jgi:hypothetical protein